MTAIEVIEKVVNTELANADLKYCLVNATKQPFRCRLSAEPSTR